MIEKFKRLNKIYGKSIFFQIVLRNWLKMKGQENARKN